MLINWPRDGWRSDALLKLVEARWSIDSVEKNYHLIPNLGETHAAPNWDWLQAFHRWNCHMFTILWDDTEYSVYIYVCIYIIIYIHQILNGYIIPRIWSQLFLLNVFEEDMFFQSQALWETSPPPEPHGDTLRSDRPDGANRAETSDATRLRMGPALTLGGKINVTIRNRGLTILRCEIESLRWIIYIYTYNQANNEALKHQTFGFAHHK